MRWIGLKLVAGPAAIAATTASAQPGTPEGDPYAVLRDGYAIASPERAADAYADDATYVEDYPGAPSVRRVGRAAIRDGFADLFRQLKLGAARRADLNFRLAADGRSGFYRLRVPDMPAGYGRFAVETRDGRFTVDRSGPASRDDFEEAAGPLRFDDADEELDADYYDRPVGRYLRRPGDGCGLVVTRSVRRYFVLNECDRSWRGLNRRAGRAWTAGNRVLDPTGTIPVTFTEARDALSWGGVTYRRVDTVTRTALTFAAQGSLAGTLYRPNGSAGRRPAVVLVHGSGPQDRNGYASLMALYAEHLARRGFVVLSFDKRGTGGSRGDWAAAGFPALAVDVNEALTHLRGQPDVDTDRVGLMGSSQAGWVVAEAIRRGGEPAFVILIGAAGTTLTVPEQNLYNTRVRMECAGISADDIALALSQQAAFFAARLDPAAIPQLTDASARAAERPAIADWLFPATVERSASPQWYDVLDMRFDPLPVWRSYRGRALLIFGEHDDSTSTALAMSRLAALPNVRTMVLPGAQHIGLMASGPCAGELDQIAAFSPDFFRVLDAELRAIKAGARRAR